MVPVLVLSLILFLISSGLRSDGVDAIARDRPFRIGVLTSSWGPTPATVALRDGLLALGYREDKDFVIGVRFTQGDLTALPAAARELVQYGVDLIFTVPEINAAKAAQMATTQIPIVFASAGDPLQAGLIASFARPGGNITGVTYLTHEIAAKRLQVFQEVNPTMQRVLFPYDASDAASVTEADVYRAAARRLGIELVELALRTPEAAQDAMAQVRQSAVDGILAPRCCSFNIPGLILDTAAKQNIPTMFRASFYPMQRNGLASYGQDLHETGRQAARLVDKIINGAHPGKIPVEANTKIEFVINLKTAQALGLRIAPEVLYQADRIIR
jgi:putative ABC transport system substrate-binding protein